MLIRYGYEMTFACGAPTPMICQLDVHPSCVPAVRAETPFAATPHVNSWLYADVFGNRCRRFNAPAGDLTIAQRRRRRSERPARPRRRRRRGNPGRGPARRHAALSRRQPLLSKPTSSVRSPGACSARRAPGWARVQAICDFVNGHIAFGYRARARDAHGLRGLSGARRRLPRFRPSRGRVLPLHEHSGALLQRLSRRHRRAARSRADGLQRLVRRLSRRQWLTFDARHNMPRIGRILIARGRDAADIPLVNSFGPHVLKSFRVVTEETNTVTSL